MKYFLAFTSLFIISLPNHAENLIVQFDKKMNKSQMQDLGINLKETLVSELEIHLVETTNAKSLKSFSFVKNILKDEKLKSRESEPNDSSFDKLWNLKSNNGSDMQAFGAWEYSTGGRSPAGDDIVVAVVDGGVDINHPDLVNNIWTNTQEIPGNKVDDDQNGYVDDIHGWNAYADNGEIPVSNHGTHVAGIIGAEGNNRLHVVGVNWTTKMMAIAASSSTTSVVLKGYGYVLAQKKLWIQTQGKKGANIVATNSSFGVDRADCNSDDYKLWNEIYNSMGEAGILSIAAGPNAAWDVDAVGDVPTGCSSPYLVSVTNTTKDNKIYQSAGWGKTTIDLGAPGTEIYSTVPENKVDKKTGTSMATPHVAGAIGLLYSLYDGTNKTPAENALYIKNLLLSTTTPMPDLNGKTVSGGKLNLKNAVEKL